VADSDDADSILWFQLKRGGDEINRCRKMKRLHQVVLAPREGSVIRHDGLATLAGGEAAPGRVKGGDDTSWADANLTGPKNKENPRGKFRCHKWTVKI
jgi:hypothetical protein